MKKCEICEVLGKDQDVIFDTNFWRVGLDASDQYYPGRCFVTVKRHVGDLADLSNEEWDELQVVIGKVESAIRQAFGAVLFNWSCLMNNSCQEKPYNPHVHWHVRPRYDKKITIGDENFQDNEFGHHYAQGTNRVISAKTKSEIIGTIQKFI